VKEIIVLLSVFLTSYTLSGQFQSHVTAPDSSVFLLENVQALNTNVNTGLYFKTGNGPYNYTGAIKTIGSSTVTARLSFFTFASSSPNGLKERLAIFDSGNIAIAGKISGVLDPVSAQDAATKAYVDDLLIGFGISLGSTGIEGLLALGYSVSNLLAAGASVSNLLAAGASPLSMHTAGVSIDSLYGKTYAGGLIFYLDTLNTHSFEGLVAAPVDQSTSIAWITGGSTQTTLNGNTSTEIGTGLANTTAMMNQDGYDGGAAKVCLDYMIIEGGVTYDDWFLPSKEELNEMYKNLKSNGFGGFASAFYWSSTEVNSSVAWTQGFGTGNQVTTNKLSSDRVRAVRAF